MQTPETKSAVQAILREHQQLSTIITGMQRFVELLGAGAKTPGLMVLRAMLYYIREFPEQVHHPKEDCFIFARLWHRAYDLDKTIADLEEQHVRGETLVRNIEHALTRYELAGESALPVLRKMVDDYAAFYRNHMRLEEEVILPAATKWLTAQDWHEIHEAFGANRDPFAGVEAEEDLGHLFSLIVNAIPVA
ncbi:hemerythrin domain-containing protein [Burkholderia sp. Ac-20353]|uniref:hemerythrin domain-containing protein n=1 Tax=Burkholderia sp. Ac-20353 TaxID=2703894 RepID=UPI00197B8305|nr:hemerythrin domain-containing protein [Burkholderia sp. Ac-20353]MBN3789483.1 hemerythrin domain-containing protein [Burkholderia sp. Ac-20353]